MSRAEQTLQDVICLALEKGLGVRASAASVLAEAILRNASELGLGGGDFYLPVVHPASRAERNERIRREFNGQNLNVICRRYGLTARQIYRIVRRNE